MPISIPSSVDGELTNYQLQITIVKGSGSNSGSAIYLDDDAKNWPDDIRFTSSDGTTLIDFWREESDATDWYLVGRGSDSSGERRHHGILLLWKI